MEKSTQSNELYLVTNVVKEPELRKAQKRALKFFADAVKCTYGPMGGYTAYSYGNIDKSVKAVQSNYTKDGFTVLKHLDTDKPIESLLREEIRDICARMIKVVGDGTTSAVMMSSYIFDGLLKLQEEGYPKRQVINTFKSIVNELSEHIRSSGLEATLDDIYNIALTSLNGQAEYADIIKKIYEENGMNVFIDVSISNNTDTVTRTYAGMTYDTGYISPCFINNAAKKSCELYNPEIYVFESPIDTPEMIRLMKLIIIQNIENPARDLINKKGKDIKIVPTVIIAPHISRDANSYLDSLIESFSQVQVEQRFPLCIVAGINNYNQYLLDIMSLTGAKFIKKYIDPRTFEKDKKEGIAPTPNNLKTFAGKAEQVVIDSLSTHIINPQNMYEKGTMNYTTFFKNYIDELKELLHKYEETREELVKIGNLKRRINILQGNMVDLFVGGIGIADRDSLRDSIEDAVLNCRSAASTRVGYGANYEGLFALKAYNFSNKSDIRTAVINILIEAYTLLNKELYLPYCDDDEDKALSLVEESMKEHKGPFNMITEIFDQKVLSSIETEPVMLEAISKIITLLFNTNQFVLPDARFNIYEMAKSSSTHVIHPESN